MKGRQQDCESGFFQTEREDEFGGESGVSVAKTNVTWMIVANERLGDDCCERHVSRIGDDCCERA